MRVAILIDLSFFLAQYARRERQRERSLDAKAAARAVCHTARMRLVCKRKVALRLGELADRKQWLIRAEPTRRLLNGSMQIADLCENDVTYDVEQKAVDVKMSLDIQHSPISGSLTASC